MDHSQCAHPRTSSARAKCRRGQIGFSAPLYSLGPPPRVSKGKAVKDEDDNYGQVPRERWMECDNCGVERIDRRGTDPLTGVLRFVGPKCAYTLKQADDVVPLDW